MNGVIASAAPDVMDKVGSYGDMHGTRLPYAQPRPSLPAPTPLLGGPNKCLQGLVGPLVSRPPPLRVPMKVLRS